VTITGDLERSLETTPRLDRDAAAVTLAIRYAQALDDLFDRLGYDESEEDAAHHARTVREIDAMGRRLEAMLDRLGMAPGARPVVPRGGALTDDAASAALESLRSDPGTAPAGIDLAAVVHPAVTAADTAD
jgi:hypothetical protein